MRKSSTSPRSRHSRGAGRISGLKRYATIGTLNTAPARALKPRLRRAKNLRQDSTTCSSMPQSLDPANQAPRYEHRAEDDEKGTGGDAERRQADARPEHGRPDAWRRKVDV